MDVCWHSGSKNYEMNFSLRVVSFINTQKLFFQYVAPEIILNKGHDHSVDYWSVGMMNQSLNFQEGLLG